MRMDWQQRLDVLQALRRTLRLTSVAAWLIAAHLSAAASPSSPTPSAASSLPGATVSTNPAADTADKTSLWCARIVARLPSIKEAQCRSSGVEASGASSALGVGLYRVRIDPPHVPARGNERPLRVMLLGGIHGDELTASAIVFRWLQWARSEPMRDIQWYIVPVVNPDGLLAVKPTRVNAHGVDLNRNFPTPNWQHDAPAYWARTTGSDPRRFPGKSPLSEPESRFIHDEIERYQPDVVISVHAPFGVLDFDGPAPVPHQFGRLVLTPVGVYPGSLGNYGGVHKQVPVITIELPNAQVMPSDNDVTRIWKDMLAWIHRHARKPASTQTASGAAGSTAGGGTLIDTRAMR